MVVRNPLLALVSCLACIALGGCAAKTTGAAPGAPCHDSGDCEISSGCPFGFCTETCASISCASQEGAAGPSCVTYFNGLQVCCPAGGCPGDCNAQASGQIACTSGANCCGLDSCASRSGGGGHCYTVCHDSTDCTSGCCINTGLTDIDTGANVAGCVDPATAGGACL